MKRIGIYHIVHRATGRGYVGQSIDVDARLRQHAKGKSGDGILVHAINKHGWDAFDAKVLELCNREDLNAVERAWIAKLGTMHPGGFNLTDGGGQGMVVSDATRALVSARTKAIMTPEFRERRASKIRGVPKSEEHRRKIAAALSTPENFDRLRQMARNQSAETRAKISAANSGKTRSAETRAHMSAMGRRPENIARLAAIVSNHTPETRAKMSASAKARKARERQQREAMKASVQPELPGL